MTFQHYNRLVSHWHNIKLTNDKGETLLDKQGQPKPLTLASKSIAQHLAANLRSDGEWANSWYHTGEALAEELGINRSTAYIAIKHLLNSRVFDCRIINKEGLRAYSLLIECPEDCQDPNHYTELEKVARDGLTKPGETIGDKQRLVKPDTERRIAQTATHLSETDSPHTYRESINKQEKELDIKTLASFESNNLDQLQKSYVSLIQKAVARVKNKSAEHSRLADYLLTNPELVMVSALGLIAKHKPDSNEAYLASIATQTPLELLRGHYEVMNLSDAPRGDIWPEAEENLVRQAALEIGSWDLADLKTEYNEYLLGSGVVPDDLVEVAKVSLDRLENKEPEPMYYESLAHLVIELRAEQYGFEPPRVDNETLDFQLDDWESFRPYSGSYPEGENDPRYLAALDLHEKRKAYRESFDQRQDEFLKSLGLDPFEHDIDPYLNGDFMKSLEAERASNPELNGDAKHYKALIQAEVRTLPAFPTFAERSTSSDTLEGILVPRYKAEFLEFWRAFPESESFGHKGKRIAALKAYLNTRNWFASHAYIMAELKKHIETIDTEGECLPVDLLRYIDETPSPGYLYTEEETPRPGAITLIRQDLNPERSLVTANDYQEDTF